MTPNFTKICLSILFVFGLGLQASAQNNPIISKILENQEAFTDLRESALLTPINAELKNSAVANTVNNATLFQLDKANARAIIRDKAPFLALSIPRNGQKVLHLKLYKANVFSDEFKVSLASNRSAAFPFEGGAYYWGMVNDDRQSLAAVAINEGEISGIISIDGDTYTLGKLEGDNEDTHILYAEKDLRMEFPFSCDTDDEIHNIGGGGPDAGGMESVGPDNCVRMYVEVDYDIFVGKGGATQASNYVTAVFSQVAILYAAESINFVLNEILVWDVQDPYTGPSTSDYLYAFRDHLGGNYNGDLAHLVGYQGGGGIAYVDVLCNSFYGVGYSDINSTFNNVPAYSWTIEVVTHEIGHNLGSQHTHACAWNGNNTAIDGCGPAAGYSEGCNAPLPASGTIMSYCHLVGGVGIDFNLGFGTQPGDRIRNKVYNATCLAPCSAPTTDDAGIASIDTPSGDLCSGSSVVEVTLENFGTADLTTVTISYSLDGTAPSTYNWTGSLTSGATTTVTLPSISFGIGSHSLSAETSLPNGVADEDSSNDAATGSFTRLAESTFYADTDGDGYGDPNNTVLDCFAPTGYVSNDQDCDDTNSAIYPTAPCNDGNDCTINDVLDANCNCSGTFADDDGDGVCNANDVCPGGDDNVDSDGDGIPDYCDCTIGSAPFGSGTLTHSGSGSSSESFSFGAADRDPSFTVSGMNARTNGNPNNRFDEQVTITYVDANGNTQTYGTYLGSNVSSVSVSLTGNIQSITVSLSDGYDGNANNLSVNLSDITYCGDFCADADGDTVCDDVDVCPGFDDTLLGQPCDDADPCTTNDVWTGCATCAGTASGDSDGDGVCDALDICPGGDDNVDTDGDGIPDFCDGNNCSAITNNFPSNPLTHQGSGSSSTMVAFPPNNQDVSFTISDIDSKENGNPNNRYIDEVTVSYVDGNGATQQYGVYLGNATSTVNVNISGLVQSVSVALADAYDGDSGSRVLSVDLSTVNSCVEPSVLPEGNSGEDALIDYRIFPNPFSNQFTVELDQAQEGVEIVINDTYGRIIKRVDASNQVRVSLNLSTEVSRTQILFVTIIRPDRKNITERVLIIN